MYNYKNGFFSKTSVKQVFCVQILLYKYFVEKKKKERKKDTDTFLELMTHVVTLFELLFCKTL